MKGSFNFSPIGKVTLETLIAQANPEVNPPLNLNEVIVGVPLANNGVRNTRLNLVFKPDGRFTGPIDFFYDRIDLSQIPQLTKETAHVGPLDEEVVPTASGILALFQTKYGITFEAGEVAVSIPSVIAGTNYSHEVTFTANPNSLVWKGTLTVKVKRFGLKDINYDIVRSNDNGGLVYLNDFPDNRAAKTNGYFSIEDEPPFVLDYEAQAGVPVKLGLVKLVDVEQHIVDMMNSYAQLNTFPSPYTIEKSDVEIIRRENSPAVHRYRGDIDFKQTAYTSFNVRAKETGRYIGQLFSVGWELMDIEEYLNYAPVNTFYFQSGQQIDVLKLLPEIKNAYNIELTPTEVEQTLAEPKPGLTNGYTLDLIFNKTSLYFSGSIRFTIDLSGDPYRYITKAYLPNFDSLVGSR